MKNKILAVVFIIASALSCGAQITIADFSSNVAPAGVNFTGFQGSWAGNANTLNGAFTVSGGDASGYFGTADIVGLLAPFDSVASNFTQITVTAKIESLNAAPGVTIDLYDSSNGFKALTATFGTVDGNLNNFTSTGFTSLTMTLSPHPEGGNISDIFYYGISGAGIGSEVFRLSIQSIVVGAAVPEPSTYALIGGVLGLGLVVWRRRSRSVSV